MALEINNNNYAAAVLVSFKCIFINIDYKPLGFLNSHILRQYYIFDDFYF